MDGRTMGTDERVRTSVKRLLCWQESVRKPKLMDRRDGERGGEVRMAYIILIVVGPFGVTRRDLNAARSVPLLVRKLISVVYININMFTCASRLFAHGG